MATWDALVERAVEALGEYHNQAVAPQAARSYTAATIQARLVEKYGILILDAARLNPRRFVATHATLSYTADAEYVALSGASDTVRFRPWIAVEDYTNTARPRRMQEMTPDEYYDWRDNSRQESFFAAGGSAYRYMVQGANIYLAPKPGSALTLRIAFIDEPDGYAVAPAAPQAFPAEYHPLIALDAAISFMAQMGPPTHVIEERNDLYRRFMMWASSRETRGVRHVRNRS